MTSIAIFYIFMLVYSSVAHGNGAVPMVDTPSLQIAGVCSGRFFVCEEIEEETIVVINPDSPQFQAFIRSIEFKQILASLETLTSTPNFPYLTTEEIQTLTEVAYKLRLLECESDLPPDTWQDCELIAEGTNEHISLCDSMLSDSLGETTPIR